MKSTDLDISRMIFEQTNPSYAEYQRKCVEYYKTHLPEAVYEEETIEEPGVNELKNEESYEEKLYYNFQTMKEMTGIFFFSLKSDLELTVMLKMMKSMRNPISLKYGSIFPAGFGRRKYF